MCMVGNLIVGSQILVLFAPLSGSLDELIGAPSWGSAPHAGSYDQFTGCASQLRALIS